MGIAASSALLDDSAGNEAAYGSLETLGGTRKFNKKPVLVLDPEELEAAHAMFHDASAELLGEKVERSPRPASVLGLAPMADENYTELDHEDQTVDDAEDDLPVSDDALQIKPRKAQAIEADTSDYEDGTSEDAVDDFGGLLDEDIDVENRIFPSLPVQEDAPEEDLAPSEHSEDDQTDDTGDEIDIFSGLLDKDIDLDNRIFPSLPVQYSDPEDGLAASDFADDADGDVGEEPVYEISGDEEEGLDKEVPGNFASLLGKSGARFKSPGGSEDDFDETVFGGAEDYDFDDLDDVGEEEDEVAGSFASLTGSHDSEDEEDFEEAAAEDDGFAEPDRDGDHVEAEPENTSYSFLPSEAPLDVPLPPLEELHRAAEDPDDEFEFVPVPSSEPSSEEGDDSIQHEEQPAFEESAEPIIAEIGKDVAPEFDENPTEHEPLAKEASGEEAPRTEPYGISLGLDSGLSALEDDYEDEDHEDAYFIPDFKTTSLPHQRFEGQGEPPTDGREDSAESEAEEEFIQGAEAVSLDALPGSATEPALPEAIDRDFASENGEFSVEENFVGHSELHPEGTFETPPATSDRDDPLDEHIAAQSVADEPDQADAEEGYTLVDEDHIDGTAFMQDSRSHRSAVSAAPRGQQNTLRAKLLREAQAEAHETVESSESLLGRFWSWLRGLFS